MKKLLLITLALSTLTMATAQNNNNEPQNYVEVRGTATTMIDPNKVEISILLNQADSKGKYSMVELENQLARALREAGIDAEKQLVLTEQTSEAHKRKDAFQYKRYTLTVTSATESQNVFAAFANNDVRNAQIVRVWNDNQDEYDRKLKVEAIKNAKETAEILTGAIGQSIGKAIVILDQSNYGRMYEADVMRSPMMKTAGVDISNLPEVEFKKINIERSVVVRFELK